MGETRDIDDVRGILAGFTNINPSEDAARMAWLEAQDVVSIYFADGRQLNPASMQLREAIDLLRAGTPPGGRTP